MLIQPHIENAILNGLRPKETEDGLVTISFEPVNEDTLQCVITDNGIGREKAKEKAVRETGKKSLATEITQERIALMNKGNTHKLSFDVLDLKDDSGEAIGTQVILIIPIEEDF
jgi:sensor histidine kinase YesM